MRYPGNNANGKKYLARHAVKKCQIKNFSAGAREHVIIKDIVGRNWLPTQNIAQLCFILICKGEKEKHPNRQHQICNSFFSLSKDQFLWRAKESPSNSDTAFHLQAVGKVKFRSTILQAASDMICQVDQILQEHI
ncbi:uncharacterized protein M6D78_010316 [Vipera latastei]